MSAIAQSGEMPHQYYRFYMNIGLLMTPICMSPSPSGDPLVGRVIGGCTLDEDIYPAAHLSPSKKNGKYGLTDWCFHIT